jgi:hypothetical protein
MAVERDLVGGSGPWSAVAEIDGKAGFEVRPRAGWCEADRVPRSPSNPACLNQSYGATKVNLCQATAKLPQFPQRTPPLTLARTTTATLDGAPHVKEFRVLGRYRNSYNFEVRVDIDTRRPIGPRWAEAETIVSRLRLPQWPTNKTC